MAAALDEHGLLTEPRLFGRLERQIANVAHPPFEFCIVDEAQDIGVAELRFLAALGARRASKRGSSSLADRVRGLLAHAITILPFDDAAAERYGSLRASLESEGKPLDEPDLRIAAIALSRSLILITGNVRHFERVDGLEIQNWLDPESPRSGQTLQ